MAETERVAVRVVNRMSGLLSLEVRALEAELRGLSGIVRRGAGSG
jgi:hypothetical protein